MRLGVYPAAAPTPMGVFTQRFEALFPHAGALSCAVCHPVCHPVHHLLPCRPAAALPARLHNPLSRWVCQLPPCPESSMPWLSVSTPTTGLDECFFFICLVVGLPYSRIFCQFWLFFVLNCCWPSFGWVRRHSVSTYASVLARSPPAFL